MASWLAVDKNGTEYIYEKKPDRCNGYWDYLGYNGYTPYHGYCELPSGSIKELIGKELTWKDEPVELKEEE